MPFPPDMWQYAETCSCGKRYHPALDEPCHPEPETATADYVCADCNEPTDNPDEHDPEGRCLDCHELWRAGQ